MKLPTFLTFFAMYVVTNIYIARRLYLSIFYSIPYISVSLFVIAYAFFASSFFIGFCPPSHKAKKQFNTLASYWVGAFVCFALLFPVMDGLIFVGYATGIIYISPNIRLIAAVIVVVVSASIIIFSKYCAGKVRVTSYNIAVDKLTAPKGIKIAMIADLHLGSPNGEKILPQLVVKCDQLKPDIVCLVGDIFSDDFNLINDPAAAMDLFKSIKTRYGVYACLGNHDSGNTLGQMLTFLEECNIKILNDEHIVINNQFALLGRLDAKPLLGFGGLQRASLTDVKQSIDTSLPVIVIDHNPKHIHEYDSDFDLILCGHTHKGQVFPWSVGINLRYPVTYGHYRRNSKSPHVIVTSGVSTWGPPARFGTFNEVVDINITKHQP